jgi:coenzyme F420 hydrogenase subunit beta
VRNDNLKPIYEETILSDRIMPIQSKAFGPYLRLVIAQTTNPLILNEAQNGGAVTGLLTLALERKIIDGAIVSAISTEKPFCPVPFMARTPQEILESAGTRYTYSPNVRALSQAAKQDVKAIAFVGTPCQITAVRRMQEKELDHARSVKLLVGLMCSEAFSYEDLMVKHVQNELGIDLHKVRKNKVAADKMTIITSEGEKAVPLADIKKYARKSCENCLDFSSELADISAGGLGLGQWTLVIVRTPIGEKVLAEAERARALITRPVQLDDPPVKLLMRLSQKKHNREAKT